MRRCVNYVWLHSQATCIETSDTAFCARDPYPAPECESPDSAERFCDGAEIVGCESGYAATEESCATGQICVALGTSGDPTCVEVGSEGTCPDDFEGGLADALAWCDDGVLVYGPPCSGSCNVVTEGGSSTAECSD